MSKVFSKSKPFGRIVASKKQPANLPEHAKPREWQYHATKGWRSYRKD